MKDNPDNVEATQALAPKTGQNIVVGDVVMGRYKILRHLDKGGMGMIFEAEDNSLGRIVALKVMHAPEDVEGQQRFKREASVAAQLQHPHTVRIFDYGCTESGSLFLVMELLQGHTFKSEFTDGPIAPLRLLRIMRQICGALGEAHDKRIIHRDIKPSNIFITHHDSGFAKLLDFGLVKSLDGKAELSQTGLVLGSPLYMSPEQVEANPIDQRSDIYSLGMTMYHAATATEPYSGTLSKILMAHLVKDPPSFANLAQPISTPPLLEWIIFTCIQKDPNRRFQDIKQLKKALEICEESLTTGKQVSLALENGALVYVDGAAVDVAHINKTEIYTRSEELEGPATQSNAIAVPPVATAKNSFFNAILLILVLLCMAAGVIWFVLQSPKEQVAQTKTVMQTQVIQVPKTILSEQIIRSNPSGATVFFEGDTTPFCTTPCPPLQLKEGEERGIILQKDGFLEERRKLIWNMESAEIILQPETKTKTKSVKTTKVTVSSPKTQVDVETKTQTQKEETKKDGGLLKDPFDD